MTKSKSKKKKEEKEIRCIYDLHTFQSVENEVYIGARSEGKDILLIFSAIELLEWLDIPRMKSQAVKYIELLQEGNAENLK